MRETNPWWAILKKISSFLLFLPLAICLSPEWSSAQKSGQSVQQKTEGGQSPAGVTGRDMIVNSYNNYYYFLNGKQIFPEDAMKNLKPEETRAKIIENQKEEFRLSTLDAEKWADNFIDTLAERKERLKIIEEDKRRVSDEGRIKLPILFGFLFQTFDEMVSALEKRLGKKIKIRKEKDFEYLKDWKSSQNREVLARRAVLPDGSAVEIIVYAGLIEKGIITEYPHIYYNQVVGDQRRTLLTFKGPSLGSGMEFIIGSPGPISYPITYPINRDFLNENFQKSVVRLYEKLFEIIL